MVKKKRVLITQLLIFAFLFVYFTRISPIVPFDGDDWSYVGSFRLPVPLLGAWNPTRILPEVLTPMGGYIAAFIIYPLTHNYVGAITGVEAFILTIFVVAFLYAFYLFLSKKLKFSVNVSIAGELLFLLSFFLIFKHMNASSYGAFWTVDLSCYFFYVIPGLLNGTMVMYMARFDDFSHHFSQMRALNKGMLILALYFTLFSNTQLNIIIATYCFCDIINNLRIQRVNPFKHLLSIDFWKSIYVQSLVLLVWIVSIAFDLTGQRARNVVHLSKQGAQQSGLNSTLVQFKALVSHANKWYLILILLAMVLALCVVLRASNKQSSLNLNTWLKMYIISIVSLVISFVYLVLAYSVAGSQYANRPDAMWAMIFYVLLPSTLSMLLLLKVWHLKPVIPLLLVLESLVAFNFNCPNILPTNNNSHDSKTAIAVDNYIIDQIVKADKDGKSTVNVLVPKDSATVDPNVEASNWPHSFAMAKHLQNTLYAHRLIRSRIKITFKPTTKVNKQFYENKTQEQPFIPIE